MVSCSRPSSAPTPEGTALRAAQAFAAREGARLEFTRAETTARGEFQHLEVRARRPHGPVAFKVAFDGAGAMLSLREARARHGELHRAEFGGLSLDLASQVLRGEVEPDVVAGLWYDPSLMSATAMPWTKPS